MPWKETPVKEQRIRFVVLALKGVDSFSGLCREFGISRPTGYHWLRRYHEVGSFGELKERSRRPHHSPNQTPSELEERVKELREQYGWGARKLCVLLEREGIRLTTTTVNRILKRRGCVGPQEAMTPAVKRFEKDDPNDLWQMDFKGEYRCRQGICYPLSILDDHSRYAIGLQAYRSQKWEPVWEGLQEIFQSYGLPRQMLLDHGTPWYGTTNGHGLTRLSVELIKQGIGVIWSGVGHPQTQGKVERFHGTLARTVRHRGRPQQWDQWPGLLAQFRHEYNHIRPHEALQMKVPAECYRKSPRSFQSHPPTWSYPDSVRVQKLNSRGTLYWGRHYFVCEALAGEWVGIQEVDHRLLVSFRHLYIREIDLQTGRTQALITPTGQETAS